jgi:hypothetical protein
MELSAMPVTVIDYDDRQAGDLIVVQATKRPIPPGWTDLTWNRDTADKVQAYRVQVGGDPDVRDVWGRDGVIVMTVRGAQPVEADSGGSTAPAVTFTPSRGGDFTWVYR